MIWWWTATFFLKGQFYHATAYFGHGLVPDYQQVLAPDKFGWGLVLILLHNRNNVEMFMRLLTQSSIIYTGNASCHFWCCIRIHSFPSSHLPLWVSSCVYEEYLISLNAIQKHVCFLIKKTLLHHVLYWAACSFVLVSLCSQSWKAAPGDLPIELTA